METPPAPLLGHFDALDDPRVDRTKLHPLPEILFIAIAGTVAGAEGWRELEAFARAKEGWLRRYLARGEGNCYEGQGRVANTPCSFLESPKLS